MTSVKINYDGDLVFTSSTDKTIQLWRTSNGERIGSFSCDTAIKSIDITKDSKWLIAGCFDSAIEVFHVNNGVKIGSMRPVRGRMKYLELNFAGNQLVTVE